MSTPANHHATAVVIGDVGILIRGQSGSGKTTLALALLSWGHASGRFATMVCDDQAILSTSAGRLICSAPGSIAGLVEVRGRHPIAIPHEHAAVLDLVVDLVEPAAAPRFADNRDVVIEGCNLALLVLEQRNADGAFAALASCLHLSPFHHKAPAEASDAAKWPPG